MKIIAESLKKEFNDRLIFKDINFEVNCGESLAITGPNGSGKTTLLRIISGLIRPASGKLIYKNSENEIPRERYYEYIGLVGPYLELYEELTGLENMQFVAKMRNIPDAYPKIMKLMERMNLNNRENDPVKNYSSGMKQRLKYVFALLHNPAILILDEPTSNLDKDGIKIVYDIMNEQKKDKILILAANDENDLKYGDKQVAINS